MELHWVIVAINAFLRYSASQNGTNVFVEEYHWKHFVADKLEQETYLYSVLSIATLCLQHSCNPPRLTLNQILTCLCINLVPLLLHPLPKFQHPTWCHLILSQLPLEVIPQVFNGVEVWGMCWPQEDLEIMVFKPSLGLLAGVLGVIILLEDDITCRFPIVADDGLNIFLQNLDVEIPIHPPINFSGMPNSIPKHAAPHHQRSTTKLLSHLNQPITQVLSCLFPDPLPPI